MASRIIPNVHIFARSRAVFHKIPINPVSVNYAFYIKCFSTSSPTYNAETDSSLNFSPSGSPSQVKRGKWLSTIKTRVGKCVFHGMRNEEIGEAASILTDLSKNWREYVAGSEGFLTGEHRRGLFRHSVVWGDMDSMGNLPVSFRRHVNNVTYVRWAESARVLWALNYAYYIDPLHSEEWKKLSTPKDIGMILKSIKVDYKFPMEWPDKVSVYHKLNSIDSESFTLDVMILSEKTQRPAARCLEDIVIYDYKAASKAPVPDWVRNQFNKTLRLQNEVAASAHKAMKDMERRVDNLERKVLSREEEK